MKGLVSTIYVRPHSTKENFYSGLLKKLFGDQLRFEHVLALQGKASVIKRYRENLEAGFPLKEFYIV